MMRIRLGEVFLIALLVGCLAGPQPAEAARRRATHEPVGSQLFTSPQSQPLALSADGSRLYVANTTSNTVSEIATTTGLQLAQIEVGIDPVSLAVRPGTDEVWVSNHVSDSVSVIDVDPASASFRRVIATVQSISNGVTDFDEPVGIAFDASGSKAYVALSSTNRIAVIDAASRSVTTHLPLTAQEPRALAVRGGLLYVAALETGNTSELSSCINGNNPPQCTLGTGDLLAFATNPNLPNAVKNIVLDPDLPDFDVFVFDTSTDQPVDVVSGVGTLLYGLAVDSGGTAYIAQTDARNEVNGADGLNLIDLDNRMFLNEVARVGCNAGGCSFTHASDVFDLEPANPTHANALATPYGIAVSGDDSTLVVTAAASSRVFTMNTATMAITDVLDLGSGASAGQQIPRGVALQSDGTGAPQTAWVLNTLDNTVAEIDVSNPANLQLVGTTPVGSDPTPPEVRRGRIAFNNAFASDTGTFSCASCHPDGNTDQLLWRIGGNCAACSSDEPRSTMPVRGLKNTLPLHWDGTLGDPFGGGNGDVGPGGNGGTDCTLGDADDDHDCFVDLGNASLSGVMCDQTGACPPGGNQLSAGEIDDMAFFLASISYPPARSRSADDLVDSSGMDGFRDFFTDQGGLGGALSTCADAAAGCHALPLGTSTNSPVVGGFDAPTMRGMTDRFIHFSNGITSTQEFIEGQTSWTPADGFDEEMAFAATFPSLFTLAYGVTNTGIFQMFEQASTGYSGALGRQVTLDSTTTTGAALAATEAIVDALEVADENGLVNQRAVGVRDAGSGLAPITLSYRGNAGNFVYKRNALELTHAQLIAEAQAGTAIVTLTGALRQNHGTDAAPQPLLATNGTGAGPTGNPPLPVISGADPPAFNVSGTDVRVDAAIFVDGVPVTGSLSCTVSSDPDFCQDGVVSIDLDSNPGNGLRLLQVLNPSGPLSNEMPICFGNAGNCT